MRAQLLSRRRPVLALLLAAFVLVACAKDNDKPPGPKNLSGRIQVLTFGGTAPQLAAQQTVIEKFVRDHPDLGVDFIRTASEAEARDRLAALIDADRAPDIVLPASATLLVEFLKRDMWVDLAGYLSDTDEALDAFSAEARRVALAANAVIAIPFGSKAGDPSANYFGALVAEAKQHDRAWQLLQALTLDRDVAVKLASEGFGLVPAR